MIFVLNTGGLYPIFLKQDCHDLDIQFVLFINRFRYYDDSAGDCNNNCTSVSATITYYIFVSSCHLFNGWEYAQTRLAALVCAARGEVHIDLAWRDRMQVVVGTSHAPHEGGVGSEGLAMVWVRPQVNECALSP